MQRLQIGNVKVTYKFKPYDDPEARGEFPEVEAPPQTTPQAREWYCSRNILVLAKMDPTNRANWNAVIG